jgi:hypothetical protein
MRKKRSSMKNWNKLIKAVLILVRIRVKMMKPNKSSRILKKKKKRKGSHNPKR